MKLAVNYIVFFFLFALLGFSREFLFVNINNQLYKLYYGHNTVVLPDSLHYISTLSYNTLYYGKYPLTIAYFLAYFFTTFFAIKVICRNKIITKWVIYIYTLLVTLAGLSMLYNYAIKNNLSGDEYTFSRWLMGIAQSPLVAFFTIASSKLYDNFTQHNTTIK